MYFIQVINLFLISVCRQIFSFIIIYKFLSNGLLQGICACLNSAIWRPIANIRISIHELKWNVLSPMSRRFYHVERWNPNRQRDGCPAQDNGQQVRKMIANEELPAFWSVGCLTHKSESFRLRFVLFTTVHSADFPLFPSSPARFFRILGQKWIRIYLQVFFNAGMLFASVSHTERISIAP